MADMAVDNVTPARSLHLAGKVPAPRTVVIQLQSATLRGVRGQGTGRATAATSFIDRQSDQRWW